MSHDYDYIIAGSGFGGSVSALRLARKGYRVLVVEKGKRWKTEDFPRSNWRLKKWLWLPLFGFRGIFKITFFRHVGILSGTGVGGGSLVYANTLPRPEKAFFESGSWKGLADWEGELEQHYAEAERMLGARENPQLFDPDLCLKEVASLYNAEEDCKATRVGIYFGEPEKRVEDPFFGGKGPERSGCTFCGACMTGCRHDAKNTLDKNYLYLAEGLGVKLMDRKLVKAIIPLDGANGSKGYQVVIRDSMGAFRKTQRLSAGGVILAGGVLGTVRLLLNMKKRHLPEISEQLGMQVRTNNESLMLVHSKKKDKDFSRGVAIGSIFPPDADTHLETVRYASRSGFWKVMAAPLITRKSFTGRMGQLIWKILSNPIPLLRAWFSRDFAKESVILLFMQNLDSTLRLKRGAVNLRSTVSTGTAPTASMPLANELAAHTARIIDGNSFVAISEAFTGTPITAHILGGCVIGKDPGHGVVDTNQKVFGYENMYVCDGSTISANPGVNPALTITAMTERIICGIPAKQESREQKTLETVLD